MKRPALLCLLLAGCATGSQIPDPDTLAAAVNRRYAGQLAQSLLGRYGVPQEQDVFQGQRYLLWHTDRTINWTRRQDTTTTGTIGSYNDWPWTAVPYAQTTSTRVADPQAYHCTMQVAVTEAGVIRAVGFLGKMGACQDFMP